jgi:pre-rRNA-processing protein TSR1
MLEAEARGKKRRLPRGTSDYQAAWILDDAEDGADDLLSAGSESGDEEGDAAGDETASLLGSGGVGSRTVAGESDFGDDEEEDMEVPALALLLVVLLYEWFLEEAMS